MEAESVWRKRHWGRQIVGEFLWRKRHLVEKCVQNCLGKAAQGRTKFWWCAFCGEETACCRKEASMVVQVKAALERKNGSGV
ncbi:hypothetical protein T11_3625, partial [Trichinella zimbabwensis]